MHYHQFAASPLLSPYVEKYYVLEHHGLDHEESFELASPANCYTALVFNYGVPYQLCRQQGEMQLSGSFLAGYSTHAYHIRLQGQVGMIGVVFRSSVIRNWFAALGGEDINDQRIGLSDLVGSEADSIIEQVAQACDHPARIRIVESYLINRLRKTNYPMHLADHAIRLILNHKGMIRMDDLANQLNVSPRHFRRMFSERVGLSPKFFARLKRFNYIRLAQSRAVPIPWHEFVTEGGFYDQSHFIKDWVAFCGQPPSAQAFQIRQMESRVTTSGYKAP
jgi:AraC-like DNA-binding protein